MDVLGEVRPRLRGRTLERGVSLVAGFVLVLQAVTVAALLATTPAPLADLAGVVVLLAAQALLAVCCLTRARRAERSEPGSRLAVPALVVAFAALLGASSANSDGALTGPAVQLVPAAGVQVLHLVAVVFVGSTRHALLAVAVTGPLHALVRTALSDVGVAAALDEWVLPASLSVSLVMVLAYLRSEADYADGLADRARTQAHAVRAGINRELAADETRRLVHDEVVSALRAVELQMPQEDVDRSCASALCVLEEVEESRLTRRIPEWLRSEAPLDLAVEDRGWPLDPPVRVTHALGAAAAEALRNAHRHAGVDRAEIILAGDRGRCVLEVRDHGTGLADDNRPGFGIRESILGRTASVGGSAEVRAADGGGTVVRLVWPAVPGRDAVDRAAPTVLRDRRRANLSVALPVVAAHAYLAARHPGDLPVLSLVVATVLSVVMVATAVVLARPATPARLLAVIGACAALVVAGVWAQPAGALLSLDSWVVGFAGAVLALVAFHGGPRWAALAAISALLVVLGLAAHDPTVTIVDPLGALGAPLVVIGAGTLFGRLLSSAGEAIADAEAAVTAQVEEHGWREAVAVARRSHLAHVEREVVPFLRRVRDEGATADAARTARLLGEQCRDDLVLARPMPEAARRSVWAARDRGATVVIQTGHHGSEVPDGAWPVVQAAAVRAGTQHRITVLPARGPRPARVVVTPPLDLPDSVHAAGRVVSEPLRTTVLLGLGADRTPVRDDRTSQVRS